MKINLLPAETLSVGRQNAKILLANRISLWLFVALVFLTSITLSVRILQNLKLQNLTGQVAQAQTRVLSSQDKEGYAVVLAERLKTIQSLQGDSKKIILFNLIAGLAGSNIAINSFSVDRVGNIDVSATAINLADLNNFFNGLNDKKQTSDLVSRVDLSSLSLGRGGGYRFSIKVTAK